jgi:hypothetical protein
MRRILRRPSPAMVVAFIALVLAVTGTATALRGSNTVFKDDIARNAVGKSEIRRSAVGRSEAATNSIGKSEVRRNAIGQSELIEGDVTGAQVNESTLGTVPSANNANHASSAGTTSGLLNFPFRRGAAATSQATASEIPLGTVGPFRFYAKCFIDGPNLRAVEYVALTSGVAIFSTEDEDDLGDTAYLTPNTAEDDRELETASAPANSVRSDTDDADFRASDGNIAITGVIGLAAAKHGAPSQGNGPFGPSNICLFGGTVLGG